MSNYNPAYSDDDQESAPTMPDTFRDWLKQTMSADELRDLAQHGADAGWPGITYTRDCCALFDRYEEELWTYAENYTGNFDRGSIWEMIAESRNPPADIDGLKVWIVWLMAEGTAEELADELDEEAEEEEEEEETE